jgi:hypothetical protein
MKVVKQASCLFVATLMVLFVTNVESAKAQMTKVRPDPAIAKVGPKNMNHGNPGTLAEPAIVTEDGPRRGNGRSSQCRVHDRCSVREQIEGDFEDIAADRHKGGACRAVPRIEQSPGVTRPRMLPLSQEGSFIA